MTKLVARRLMSIACGPISLPWTLRILAVSLLAAPAMGIGMAAQDNPSPDHRARHRQYTVIDMGTFGGPGSLFSNPGSNVINDRGTATGIADTPFPDPYCVFDCWVNHGFVWKNGTRTELRSLPGGASNFPVWINNDGLTAGASQNGVIDPLTAFPEYRAVLWSSSGRITELATLGGNQSAANAIGDHDEVVGGALNTIADPYASAITENFVFFAPAATQTRATLWHNGAVHDLGTLGGNDAVAMLVNNQSQVAGVSYTNTTPNPVTGRLTIDPFFWDRGRIRDLGTLGGTFGYPNWLNNVGQVVGQSNLSGDQIVHPFLSNRGKAMQDLGTLGGDSGIAFWINDAGEVVGQADLPGSGTQAHDAFLWRRGVMTDLGTVGSDPCSRALSINSQGQIVGASTTCTEYLHGFLWENGGPMVDLNDLVVNGSGLIVRDADQINDRGEIAGRGVLPNGDVHAILLIPSGECDRWCDDRIAASTSNPALAREPVKNEAREQMAVHIPRRAADSPRPPH